MGQGKSMLNPPIAAGVPPIPENVSVKNKVWDTLTAIEVDKESELIKVHKKGDKITNIFIWQEDFKPINGN